MELAGHSAIVTGGGQGIGRGIARALARAGADVAIFEINVPTAEAVSAEARAQGRRALALEVDVTDLARVEAATREVAGAFGRLDVLVNNVGGSTNEPFVESRPETWQRIVALFFASPQASYITGQVLSVNGGSVRLG